MQQRASLKLHWTLQVSANALGNRAKGKSCFFLFSCIGLSYCSCLRGASTLSYLKCLLVCACYFFFFLISFIVSSLSLIRFRTLRRGPRGHSAKFQVTPLYDVRGGPCTGITMFFSRSNVYASYIHYYKNIFKHQEVMMSHLI